MCHVLYDQDILSSEEERLLLHLCLESIQGVQNGPTFPWLSKRITLPR